MPNQRQTNSLGKQAGILIFSLMVLMAVLGALVVVNLIQVRQESSRLKEENREAAIAGEFLAVVVEMRAQGRTGIVHVESMPVFGRAEELMAELLQGMEGANPSRPEHEIEEMRIVSAVRASLRSLAESSESGGQQADVKTLDQIVKLAGSLRNNTETEAKRAADDLAGRTRVLVWATVLVTATSIVVLLVLLSFIYRRVVRPLRRLQRGTASFGEGDLGHRIRIDADNEIGTLASEFNRMADSLTDAQRGLERKVEERTHQFIRAAQLADLGTFAAGIAHEVNNPLASIASCAEGLQRRLAVGGVEPAEQTEYLETIASEAYRAHDITSRLLSFARRDAGPVNPVDLQETASDVVRLLGHQLDTKGVQLHLEIEPGLPRLGINHPELGQVLLNLVQNALGAVSEGGSIWVRGWRRGSGVVVSVDDDGPGVMAEDWERIFDPFYTTKEPGKGNGLGLPLARRIVEMQGGSLEVDDAPFGGARFRLSLPLAEVEEMG